MIFGIIGICSYIHTNNKLQKKYYCEQSRTKDIWKISPENIDSLNVRSSGFLSSLYNGKYTKLQKYIIL